MFARFHPRVYVAGLALAVFALTFPASTEPLPEPSGRVILTIDGAIKKRNAPSTARFDLAMLRALGTTEIRTETSWTDGIVVFRGVLARTVMRAVGATGSAVQAAALDGYSSLVPMSDFEKYDVILAYEMNGKQLTRRNKGPLWIIYPWTERPELMMTNAASHAVWHLKSLTVNE